jgi:capsular polysaccharide biosynthesis protein
MIARSTIDRLTIAALMLTATLPFAAITPAHAGTTQCAVQAEQLRTEAASANPQDAAKALRSIKIAEKICAEGNAHEAAKKFAQARTQLASTVQLAERR